MVVNIESIKRVDNKTIDKDYFYGLIKENQPIVFSQFAKDWDAIKKWTPEYLLDKVGKHQVDVDMCTFGPMHDIKRMEFSEYLNKSLNNEFKSVDENGNKLRKCKKPYLRNFALFDEFSEFKDDVKNEVVFNTDIHNMVVRGAFIGSPDSATDFHKDTGDNVVAVIRGAKYVIMVPPEDENNINNDKLKENDVKYNENDHGVPIEQHPAFSNCKKVYTTVLTAGESIYIPINWVHYVHNLEFTVSVSCWGKKMII
ncbi:hypothetical protein DICPUDRAFT_55855 [Dictyostelium purpureum]|uniref:JmjC domain-containing protein n=1 Tax=Dictyostelium purpureum TaxID=5786 RepID=F0ZNU8_DICPU|nr:uncharacterized protein DICPUDRAFT_55855 [Dictyostelium purpureum]EGC34356.1 hypothetical protein DICPUDRAFT_55855 [Dictyostelium purpureum]|eukprot:XP_003289090.1 hypothetical protein DICPUDRAFT_55855 [Dictyostelium purpureum]